MRNPNRRCKSVLGESDENQSKQQSHHLGVPGFFLHAWEQYRTCSQTFAHFFRHVNGRPQAGQIFVGRLGFSWGIFKSDVLPAVANRSAQLPYLRRHEQPRR